MLVIVLMFIWVGDCVNVQVSVGDCVSVCPETPGEPLYIARVSSMWQVDGDKLFHATWFSRGSETVLGETSDPSELFLADTCGDAQLESITDKVHVSVGISNTL